MVVSWETPLLKGWVTTEEHKIDIRTKERKVKQKSSYHTDDNNDFIGTWRVGWGIRKCL